MVCKYRNKSLVDYVVGETSIYDIDASYRAEGHNLFMIARLSQNYKMKVAQMIIFYVNKHSVLRRLMVNET